MHKEIIVDSSLGETRVAVVENGRLVELYVEDKDAEYYAADIYKARVEDVLPGLQSAFLDIGHEKKGFLHGADIVSLGLAEVESELTGGLARTEGSRDFQKFSIRDALREGQEIIVQVLKESIGEKGAKLTTAITIPGRYVVLMPYVDRVNVSSRIKDQRERERLRDVVLGIRPEGLGFIVRTAAEGAKPEFIYEDLEELVNTWERITEKNAGKRAPCILYRDQKLLQKTIRDIFTNDVDIFILDTVHDYEQAVKLTEKYSPDLVHKIRLYEDEEPLFDAFGIESEINRMFRRKLWLRSGGYIVIDETEALVAIDVNTGRFLGRENLEETILKTNLEAAAEIARQVRLRNIGGIIIIDFIDMASANSRNEVLEALKKNLENDRARTNILELSELGLVEMTRQRIRESVLSHISQDCPYCKGRGAVLTQEAIFQKVERDIKRAFRNYGKDILLIVHPEVRKVLESDYAGKLNQIEYESGGTVRIQEDKELSVDAVETRPLYDTRKDKIVN